MATKLWFHDTTLSDYGSGTNDANLRGTASAWAGYLLTPTQPTGTGSTLTTPTVSGTALIEMWFAGDFGIFWYSPPLAADITISGAINWNLRAKESAAQANCAINAQLEKIDGATGAVTLIDRTARTTELSTTQVAVNFSETPAAGVLCKKGDRLRVRVFAGPNGTMGASQSFTVGWGGAAAGANDSWLSLTENLTFATEPAGSYIYPTNTASDVATAAIDKEAWTSRGAGVVSIETGSPAGWGAPWQWTDAEFGTVVEWYTKKLAAVTLGGAVRVNVRASAYNQTAVRCEIAVVNDDGSSPSVWAVGTYPFFAGSSEYAYSFLISGADKAVGESQRLRIRFYTDDPGDQPRLGSLAYVYYGGAAGATGDTYLRFGQTLSIFVPKAATYALTAKGGGIVTPVGRKGAVAGGSRVINYRDTVMATAGLVGYWRLGDTSGGAVDEKGANHGTYVGPIQSVDGAILDGNKAVRATAANCTVACTAPTAALEVGDVVTMEVWINRDGAAPGGWGGIISKGGGAYYLRLNQTTGQLSFVQSRVVELAVSANRVPLTGWHHIVATKNGANIRMYIDGVMVTNVTTGTTLTNNGLMLFFGSDNDANWGGSEAFIGLIDETAVYNVAVPAADALAHFLASGRQRMFPDFAFTGESYDATTVGNRFTVNEAGLITAIRYNHHPGDGNTTHHFRIYDGSGALVGTYADPCLSDPTSGWRQFGITPLAVVPGTYTIAWWGAGWYYAYVTPKIASTSASLTYLAPYNAYGVDQYPTNPVGNYTYNLDVVFQPTGAGGTVMTGGGVATVVGVKSAAPELHYGTVVATGGGVIAYTGVKFIPEFHSGSASLTGGGVAVLAGIKKATQTQALTGGGIAVLTAPIKKATRVQALTGGGIAVIARSSARSRTVTPMTGGGVISGIPIKKATGSVQAMTGGGRVTVVGTALQQENKFGTVVVTGGGVITSGARIKKATAVAAHTGGGVLTLTTPTKRAIRSQVMTGGGVITNLTAAKQGFRLIAPTGGGVATLAYTKVVPEVRTGTVTVTGGGTITLAATSTRSHSLGTSLGGGLADGAAVSPWLDLSEKGNTAVVIGTPDPVFKTGILNGRGVVRTTYAEGRFRVYGHGAAGDFTLAYVARMRDGTAGRLLGADYTSGANFLLGWHGGYMDKGYDGSFFAPDYGIAQDTSFHLYSADGVTSNHRLFRNGTLMSASSGPYHFNNTLALGGYDNSTAETVNGDYAEVILYNEKQSDTDRQRIEAYLREKWFATGSGAGFTPHDLSGLTLWYDASALGGLAVNNGLTGGGRVAYSYATGTPEARTATVVATGGGAITVPTGVKRVARVLSMTGGGAVTLAQTKRTSRIHTMTGGGVVYLGTAPAKRATAAATGGGGVTVGSALNRRATALLTGGGVAAVARTSARGRTLPLSGGGTISYAFARTNTVSANISLTGGGVVVIARQHRGLATVRPTGGGVVTSGYVKRVARALALTGGGAITPVGRSARSAAISGGAPVGMGLATPTKTSTGDYTTGTGFTPTVNGDITHVRYYHHTGHPTGTAHTLSIWTTAGVKLGSVVDVPPDALGQWRVIALPVPVRVQAGVAYRVSRSGNGQNYGYYDIPPTPSSSSPLLAVSPVGYYVAGNDVFPNTGGGTAWYAIDVVFQPVGAVTGGGVITGTAVVFQPELHFGTARVTGGGTIALTQTKRTTRAVAATGGGVIRTTATKTFAYPQSYVIVI